MVALANVPTLALDAVLAHMHVMRLARVDALETVKDHAKVAVVLNVQDAK